MNDKIDDCAYLLGMSIIALLVLFIFCFFVEVAIGFLTVLGMG